MRGGGAGAGRPHWVILLFAVAGMLGTVLVAVLVAIFIFAGGRSGEPTEVAGKAAETVFTIGQPQLLAGTSLIEMDVSASHGGSGNPYSGRGQDTRNILLIDKKSGAGRRLLPDNDHHIEPARFLSAKSDLPEKAPGDDVVDAPPDRPGGTAPVSPVAYYVLDVDRPDSRHDILVGALSSGRQQVVMQGIDGIDGVWMQSPTQIGFIVRDRLKLFYRVIDIRPLKVVQSRRIAID